MRDSTGIVTAKLLAEKNNPQADVVWGLAATSLLLLKSEGMLEAYKPVGVEKLDKKFVDKGAIPSWVGMDACLPRSFSRILIFVARLFTKFARSTILVPPLLFISAGKFPSEQYFRVFFRQIQLIFSKYKT